MPADTLLVNLRRLAELRGDRRQAAALYWDAIERMPERAPELPAFVEERLGEAVGAQLRMRAAAILGASRGRPGSGGRRIRAGEVGEG